MELTGPRWAYCDETTTTSRGNGDPQTWLEELHKIAYDMKNFYIESSSLGHPEALFTHLVYVTGVEQPGRATAGDP
ncbi:hypothetical protein PRIPAC_88249 [Pristionchus pacificus]|uniref:Uncharacterized protein n=1 Tax=Pristionchus pacificus TaxID=54126 RepID=A0A2A6B6D4_PRIPA|nr:hypothetical protein PRIPAC_88249 [Pristionchus pacificus]|eukprot:PDM61442.1 hypothetical protein PRIPAC_50884 [Pristionchus pacificus]